MASAALTARGLGLVAREAWRVGVDRRRPMQGPVPLRVEGVTASWLESTMELPRDSVESITVLSSDSGTAARARLAIEADPGAGLAETLFVKLMPQDFAQHVLMNAFDLGAREVRAYQGLGEGPPVRIPRCHAAVLDPDRRRNIMVLEDLGPDARFRTILEPVTPAEAEAVIDAFADLHADFWQSDRLRGDLAPLAGRSAVANALGDLIRRQLVGRPRGPAAELVPAPMRDASRILFERSGEIDAMWADQPQTLIHGDTHLGNLFFVGDRPGMLDWQVATISAGIRDVAYFAASSLATDDREHIERGLVARYVARLESLGVEVDGDRQWLLYRAGVTEFYLAAVSTAGVGERMQSAEVCRTGVERAVAAVGALDSFGALEQLVASRRE